VRAVASALLAGAIFGVGLCVSGMTDPKNIIAFLDVTGAWSPNLAGVMLGAIAVHASWLRYSSRGSGGSRTASASLRLPGRIDGALLGGSALFGVGWGLSGYCPGPAIVALANGTLGTVAFVLAMLVGMALGERVKVMDKTAAPR
jgi:uncharacterized protein